MTSKERVQKTIAHQEPDRVPIGEWGIDHDHVSRIIGHHTYWRNRKETTLALWEGRRDEVVESLKHDCVELVDALDYDVVTVELVPPKTNKPANPPKQIAEGTWQDDQGRIYKYAPSNDSISCMTPNPEREEIPQDELEQIIENAGKIDESQFELIDYIADHYGNEKAILCRSVNIHGALINPFGGDYNHQLIMTLLNPDEIKKLYDACLAFNKALLDHCQKKGVLIAMQGQDFGMNTGCIISPDSIRDIFMPIMKKVNQEIVNRDMIPFYHCCGNVWDIMDDFVKVGYRGYQSIQESAGMDTKRVKELYGKDLTLWTGIQCETLVEGSIEDAEREVRKNLEFLMPGGGFIFGSTNSVQYGAKTENYLRALEIVRKYGVY
ncbi:MAG: uroporphyrinogen decarboxylase family protein [Candidatus Merdivicinus sp.]|jgi:uroporphyrinogen decarboxylase